MNIILAIARDVTRTFLFMLNLLIVGVVAFYLAQLPPLFAVILTLFWLYLTVPGLWKRFNDWYC